MGRKKKRKRFTSSDFIRRRNVALAYNGGNMKRAGIWLTVLRRGVQLKSLTRYDGTQQPAFFILCVSVSYFFNQLKLIGKMNRVVLARNTIADNGYK